MSLQTSEHLQNKTKKRNVLEKKQTIRLEAAADSTSGAAISSEWKLVESEEQLDLLFTPSAPHATNTNRTPLACQSLLLLLSEVIGSSRWTTRRGQIHQRHLVIL